MVDSGECMVEVRRAMVHRCVDGGSFGERALRNDDPRAASIQATYKALMCFHTKQEVFKKITTE